MTGDAQSTLARHADVVLDIAVDREACPLNLAPTTSGLTTLVMGDALAIALMEKRGPFNPSGPEDLMVEDLPFADPSGGSIWDGGCCLKCLII